MPPPRSSPPSTTAVPVSTTSSTTSRCPCASWLPVYAQTLGAKPPRRVPAWLARLAAGPDLAGAMLTMRGASNAKAKRELGWEPAHPSWRQGFRDSLS